MSQTSPELPAGPPPSYFTQQLFDVAQAEILVKFEADPDAILRISEITGNVHTDFALPGPVSALAIVLRKRIDGAGPLSWDTRLKTADPTEQYVPATVLESANPLAQSLVTRVDVQQARPTIFEMSVPNFFQQDMGVAMAETLMGTFRHPNAEWSAVGTMLDTGRSPITNIRRLQAARAVARKGILPFIIQRGGEHRIVRRLGGQP